MSRTGRVGVGVIGAGVISSQYLDNLTTFPDLDVLFVADIDLVRAKAQAEKYDIAGTQAQATGTMTITGVSKPVSVPVTLTASDKGVQVEGNTKLEFATFNIEPPAVFLGMLKVGPQIRVSFKGTIAR